jgi:hypothetical protein
MVNVIIDTEKTDEGFVLKMKGEGHTFNIIFDEIGAFARWELPDGTEESAYSGIDGPIAIHKLLRDFIRES